MFDSLLLRAVEKSGSILAVAEVLAVQPKTIYGWIAGVERPKSIEQDRYCALLAAMVESDREPEGSPQSGTGS